MQTANILLSLGGDDGNQVPKFGVTAAEIAVLRAIHGEASVTNIAPLADGVDRTNRAELARLRAVYGRATDAENNAVVDSLFPGAAARVFETIDELELPDEVFAASGRVSPAAPAPAPAPVETASTTDKVEDSGLDALTVPKLRELADAKDIDLGEATKKADIIERLEAADVTADEVDEDDGVEDMAGDGVLG